MIITNLYRIVSKRIKGVALLLLLLFVLFFNTGTLVSTAPADSISQTCIDKLKSDPQYSQYYSEIYYAQRADTSHALSVADCPASVNDLSLLVVRIIVILITLIGLVVFFSFIRYSFIYITAGANKDKIKAARAGIQNTFVGVFIILLSYSLIVFIAVRLGLSDNSNNFSIIDGGRLVFKFIFTY